ncbi:hypothetical protein N658DRAFT_358604 [Parathielavia hyrcaniae]|uniref:Uncharacterized protein n=1 Tax=Parathielavia hyrcaniae TaxID=113614 RepID=A0AAN6Q7R3_9PEZI|nr:hypothetical protein N658DRAFT_358604 [Parathielavia hyrcaniae]
MFGALSCWEDSGSSESRCGLPGLRICRRCKSSKTGWAWVAPLSANLSFCRAGLEVSPWFAASASPARPPYYQLAPKFVHTGSTAAVAIRTDPAVPSLLVASHITADPLSRHRPREPHQLTPSSLGLDTLRDSWSPITLSATGTPKHYTRARHTRTAHTDPLSRSPMSPDGP